MTDQDNKTMFTNINSSDMPTEIESFCVNCQKNGKTKLLFTSIPMFREIIISSFYCEHCEYKDNEVQFAGQIKDKGIKISLVCTTIDDFKRDVICSQFAQIIIPDLGLEIPQNRKGMINTIEGLISNMIDDLTGDQEARKQQSPELYEQIETFLKKLEKLLAGQSFPFSFQISDPSGNSYIKNPFLPKRDPNLTVENFIRTKEQLQIMGYSVENEELDKDSNQNATQDKQVVQTKLENLQTQKKKKESQEKANEQEKVQNKPEVKQEGNINEEEEKKSEDQQKQEESKDKKADKNQDKNRFHKLDAHLVDFTKPLTEDTQGESMVFPVQCHGCGKMGEQNCCTASIPYFKEIIIYSFRCDFCGCKSTDVKVGGAVSELGIKITCQLESDFDLKRDVFLSSTASIEIPEVGLETNTGTLAGTYSTVEGLLDKIIDEWEQNQFISGDSDSQFTKRIKGLLDDLKNLKEGKTKFTLIITDLQDNSFVQNPYYPQKDPKVVAEKFKRTKKQDDELGITEMKTENY